MPGLLGHVTYLQQVRRQRPSIGQGQFSVPRQLDQRRPESVCSVQRFALEHDGNPFGWMPLDTEPSPRALVDGPAALVRTDQVLDAPRRALRGYRPCGWERVLDLPDQRQDVLTEPSSLGQLDRLPATWMTGGSQ